MPKEKSKDWEKRIRDFIKKIDYGGNWTPLGLKQHGDTLISIIRSQLTLSYSQGYENGWNDAVKDKNRTIGILMEENKKAEEQGQKDKEKEIINNTPIYGCDGCNTTGGRLACPHHRV